MPLKRKQAQLLSNSNSNNNDAKSTFEEIEKKDFFREIFSLSNGADAKSASSSASADTKDASSSADITVLVGPEGDFSIDEVRLALENGYESVSLGTSRLRTETAGLVAVHMAHIARRL